MSMFSSKMAVISHMFVLQVSYQPSLMHYACDTRLSIFSHAHMRRIIYLMHELLWPLVTEEFNKKSVNLENIVNFGNLLNVLAFSFSILHYEIYSQ